MLGSSILAKILRKKIEFSHWSKCTPAVFITYVNHKLYEVYGKECISNGISFLSDMTAEEDLIFFLWFFFVSISPFSRSFFVVSQLKFWQGWNSTKVLWRRKRENVGNVFSLPGFSVNDLHNLMRCVRTMWNENCQTQNGTSHTIFHYV